MEEKYKCPVCGEYELEECGIYDICPICGWEDDPLQYRHPNYKGGANDMSLNEAREAYLSSKNKSHSHDTGQFMRENETQRSTGYGNHPQSAACHAAVAKPHMDTKKRAKQLKLIALEEKVFAGLDFEPSVFCCCKCYKGEDGFYYRLDHFDSVYVIEYADNIKYAENNWFDDADLFDNDMPEEELIRALQEALKEYVKQG